MVYSLSGMATLDLIFNKTWNQWGAFDYKDADDVLRVDVKNMPRSQPSEKMTMGVDKAR